jgi:hypothetical protein
MAGFEVITYGRFWVIAEARFARLSSPLCMRFLRTDPGPRGAGAAAD